MSVTAEKLHLDQPNGPPLVAYLWSQEDPNAPTLFIAGATGVPQRFYRRFATFCHDAGFRVLTFDYCGIAESATGPAKQSQATMVDWGASDASAVMAWLRHHYPQSPITWLGHSVGGQLLACLKPPSRPDRLVTICAQSGYWRHWPGLARYGMWLLWYGLIPVTTSVLGCFPGRLIGGTSLPRGVARQWAHFGRHPDYILRHTPAYRENFAALKRPSLVVQISDDGYAPAAAVKALYNWLPDHEHKAFVQWSPADAGCNQVGHFGFFKQPRDQSAHPLWHKLMDWLEATSPKLDSQDLDDAL